MNRASMLETKLGFSTGHDGHAPADRRQRLLQAIELRLVADGLLLPPEHVNGDIHGIAGGLLQSYREMSRTLRQHRCAIDARIEQFLQHHLADLNLTWLPRLPDHTFVLERHGVARELSLPAGGHEFSNSMLKSYRVRNGVLHNPRNDRRTTQGTFHVAEGGLPVPNDKRAVPKAVFAEMFRRAMQGPNPELMVLPYTANQKQPARTWVSLLLRPTVCPEVPGVCSQKSMEVRFFAPGSLVSNLDFVESIFGNAGDPFLPENDAGLDVEHWTGHTGCVILAPHLTEVTKKELGLPSWEQATERQRRDHMCWREPAERYNDGVPFKLTCRTDEGVIVTLVADNYYGYCKKEVKTQISYSANLHGNVEEEHAGGAIAFPSYSFGYEYQSDSRKVNGRTFADVVRDYGHWMDVRPEGYGIDREYPNLIYIPEQAAASVTRQQVWWTHGDVEHAIPLEPDKVYMTPSGFKVRMEKHPGAPSWRIIGTSGEGVFCHKPCTVSGGGKSEISKSLNDYMLYGPIFLADVKRDFDLIDQIFTRDYSTRWVEGAEEKPDYAKRASRPILSPDRSLGSVIKLLTPSPDFTEEYNAWLHSIPSYIYPAVFIIKRFYKPTWGGDWRSHFGVDFVNGHAGNELKLGGRKLVGTYLRVGFGAGGEWRTFKVRQDFYPAGKIQTEDDISASVVVPTKQLAHLSKAAAAAKSVKFAVNCEYRLFQRPDEAIHRGFDNQAERDLARGDNFISNFEPLPPRDVKGIVSKVADFDQYTKPMQDLLQSAAGEGAPYTVASDHPRIVDGKPTKNPRYLQTRPDLIDPMSLHVVERGIRLNRVVPADKPVYTPVNAVLIGRRNNPADAAAHIRGLAVYSPIHYQELPELFMDFICSLTGKSPSTTGAGSEGALTKAPFNALRPTTDLNNALVSYILTGLAGFSTSAGNVGPNVRVDHDISLLVPEIWCRLSPRERDPVYMIREGFLELVKDFTHNGELIRGSRLGYRITRKFVGTFFGRVFDNPSKVFDDAILRPETQSKEDFVDGIKNITEAQQRVAAAYLEDGSVNAACPPLRALIHIMARGNWEGMDAHHPELRAMFTRESLLKSDWYRQRLETKQKRDVALWKRHVAYLDQFIGKPTHRDEAQRLGLAQRRDRAAAELARVQSPEYLEELEGTIGADPIRL
jgi:hypothetical protein